MRLLLPLLAMGLLWGQSPDERKAHYRTKWAPRLEPLLVQVVRFPTVAGHVQAHKDQKAWLERIGRELGFTVRDAGPVTEIDLPGPDGAPVLGLVVHGDVQPVDDHWSFPPFAGEVRDGMIRGRGTADDKGPLVQALLAMRTLADLHPKRTHTLRLLVGSDEESGSSDMPEYLKGHKPPDFSLVLDANFPVTVGEKAWIGYWVDAPLGARDPNPPLKVLSIDAGLAPSIVPDRATLHLEADPSVDLAALGARLKARPLPPGTRLEVLRKDRTLEIRTFGRAAHGGVNLEGGRNALVALARAMEGELPPGGAADLLAFVRLAGQDLHGASLGLPRHPVFGATTVNPALLKAQPDGTHRLFLNLRHTPALSNQQLRAHLDAQLKACLGRTYPTGGWFDDPPLAFDPEAKLVKRLMAVYHRVTGTREPPSITGGGTYAKALPRAIAFGMWFPDKPYPGHDVDEQVSLADLHKGTEVLLEALADLALNAPIQDPFKPGL